MIVSHFLKCCLDLEKMPVTKILFLHFTIPLASAMSPNHASGSALKCSQPLWEALMKHMDLPGKEPEPSSTTS